MQRSHACLLLLALLCAFFFLGCSAAKTEPEADTDPVVARYRDTELRQSLVDYEKKNLSALSGGKEVRDRDAVNQLLVNLIMLDEAERLGLSVTQEEVDAEFAAQKKNYEDFLEVRTYIDAYCKTAEITLEEYYAAIQEQLPLVILRQKLRNELGREYCAEHRLEFTKVNPPEDMQRYVENYLEGLLDTCCADITYCK